MNATFSNTIIYKKILLYYNKKKLLNNHSMYVYILEKCKI